MNIHDVKILWKRRMLSVRSGNSECFYLFENVLLHSTIILRDQFFVVARAGGLNT